MGQGSPAPSGPSLASTARNPHRLVPFYGRNVEAIGFSAE